MCRLLSAASAMSGKLSPREQTVMEGALNLAVRLGLPAEKLLRQLLHTEGGAQLYQAYHRAVCSELNFAWQNIGLKTIAISGMAPPP